MLMQMSTCKQLQLCCMLCAALVIIEAGGAAGVDAAFYAYLTGSARVLL